MQNINNMGSLLQAYGLQKILTDLSHDVEFIDIEKIDEDYKLVGDAIQIFNDETEKKGFLEKLKRIDKYAKNRIKNKHLEKEQVNIFEEFRKSELNLNNKNNLYDLCVIGSDEVFNCLNTGYWGFTSQLFGNVKNANKVITYAASCGSTNFSDLPKSVCKKIELTFEKVSAFSVRDKNTRKFVSNLSNKYIEENFDPVLVSNIREDIANIELPTLPQSYCVIYSYRNRIHNKQEIKSILEFCKDKGYTPISIGAPQFWTKEFIPCSPFQCLSIFANANFVITDTFHGTIFSTIFSSKFAVISRASNRNKLLDLVEKLHVENHLMNDFNELEKVHLISKNVAEIETIIQKERDKTYVYLKKNVNYDE